MSKDIIFIPNEEDKQRAINLCNQIIDFLEPYDIEMKSFILQNLITSFQDVYNINLMAIKYDEEIENEKD